MGKCPVSRLGTAGVLWSAAVKECMTRRKKIFIAVAAAVSAAGLLALSFANTTDRTEDASSAPVIDVVPPSVESDAPEVDVPVNDVDNDSGVDIEDFDITAMNLTYEALAVVSAYFHISSGDIGDDARAAVVSKADSAVAELFAQQWTRKEELVDSYPAATVFTDVRSISDVPSSDADVTIAVFFDVYESADNDPPTLAGTFRWKIHFTIEGDPTMGSDALDWRISGVSARSIN